MKIKKKTFLGNCTIPGTGMMKKKEDERVEITQHTEKKEKLREWLLWCTHVVGRLGVFVVDEAPSLGAAAGLAGNLSLGDGADGGAVSCKRRKHKKRLRGRGKGRGKDQSLVFFVFSSSNRRSPKNIIFAARLEHSWEKAISMGRGREGGGRDGMGKMGEGGMRRRRAKNEEEENVPIRLSAVVSQARLPT